MEEDSENTPLSYQDVSKGSQISFDNALGKTMFQSNDEEGKKASCCTRCMGCLSGRLGTFQLLLIVNFFILKVALVVVLNT